MTVGRISLCAWPGVRKLVQRKVNSLDGDFYHEPHMMERAVPILPGDDLAVAKEFYVGKLGFEVEWEDAADGKSGIMGLSRGTIELTIDCPMAGHGRNVCASLRVGSADAYYDEWRQKVEIGRPPRNEQWGARTFGLQDPFGNTIFVIGPGSA